MRRYLCVVKHSKHSLFVWVPAEELVSNAIEAFLVEEDYYYGILHSRIHDLWARSPGVGTQVRDKASGFRYTPTTCFDTFPLPDPGPTYRNAVTAAAAALEALRHEWLYPRRLTRTEFVEFPGSAAGPWKRYVHDPDGDQVGTVRYPRVVPKDATAAVQLDGRTLTALYNQLDAGEVEWLADAHHRLDAAVAAAYGWPADLSDDEVLARLLALNLELASGEQASSPSGPPMKRSRRTASSAAD